jgi:chromosome segregation ATPase
LLGNVEEPLNIKKMSAENRAQAYEYRIQDLQNALKTVRKAEAQAKQAEAAAIADLQALRKESSNALRAKDAELEGLRLENEALNMAYDSLKTSVKGKSVDAEHSSISVIEKNELSALNEKLRSTSSVISALTTKVEQQRLQMFESEAKCIAAEGRAAALKKALEQLQQEHEEIVNNTELQLTADRKHVHLAKDQIARMVAKHTSFEKAWTAKQTQLEKDLAESGKRVKELTMTVQNKDQQLDDLKQEILKNLWKPNTSQSGVQTEERPNRWLWLLTLKIAVMTDRDLQHEKEVQTDTVRIDGMVICLHTSLCLSVLRVSFRSHFQCGSAVPLMLVT